MMDLMNIDEDVLRRSHGMAGLKHCMEVSEEQPKKRLCGSYRRIPCRARSLSIQHNGESAYFDVPHDAPHGMPLNCSHEECINSGRRFRYCNGKSPRHSVPSHWDLILRGKISHDLHLQSANCQSRRGTLSNDTATAWSTQPRSCERRWTG